MAKHFQNGLTYLDVLCDKAPMPTNHVRMFMFQVLMAGGMVSFMATFNGILHSGFGFFGHMHWFYPIVLCIALSVRYGVADHLAPRLIDKLVKPRLHGAPAAMAKTLINTLCMCPFVSLAASILLEGANFLPFYLSSMPLSLCVAALVSYFLVGPAVKLLYHYAIHPRSVVPILVLMGKASCSLTRMFGC